MMDSSIASAFTTCLRLFEGAVEVSTNQDIFSGHVSHFHLEDQLGRLRVWAGNIGAHKVGKASLDYRLKEASHIKERIVKLLSDLEISIEDARSIILGERPDRDDASDSDTSADEHSIVETQTQDDSPQSQASKPTELQQILLTDIPEIITCLYKLSQTIRNPAPHDRYLKSASIDTSHFEFWDIQHTENKFPDAPNFLAVRLGRAISRRRQYLKYCDKHRRKLGQDIDPPKLPVITRKLPTTVPRFFESLQFLENDERQTKADAVEPSEVATTFLTQTTATTFIASNIELEVESDAGETQTSYAPSESTDRGPKLHPPPPPKQFHDNQPFECPFCFVIVNVKSIRSWTKHLFRDLQPYMCVFERCSMPDKLFASRHEWIEHDRTHRTQYFCSGDCQQIFARQSDFEDHMQNIHSNTFSKSQLPALVKMCQRTLPPEAEVLCPLCSRLLSTVQIQRHLARHLEELSLFALPRAEEGLEEIVGSDKAEARSSDSSQAHPESRSTGSSDQGSIAISVDENIPDTESNPWDIPSAASTLAEGGTAEENRSHLLQLNEDLKFSPEDFVNLKLTDENRQILAKQSFETGPSYAAEILVYLFDHAVLLVQLKTVKKREEFHVYRRPIPLEFLTISVTDRVIFRRIGKKQTSEKNLSNKELAFETKFRHLGRGAYEVSLYAPSVAQRQKFIEKVVEQQRLLREQRSTFYTQTILCEGFFNSNNRVNCLVPMDGGRKLAFGTDNGIYLSDRKDKTARPPRALDAIQVTQIDILENYQLLLVLTNKTLIIYSLEALNANNQDPLAMRPKTIQGRTDFFKVGICQGRDLVCCVKASSISTTIKLYEPTDILEERRKKPGISKIFRSQQDALKPFKEFYMPNGSSSVHFLRTTLCVGCASGFQVISLETLEMQSVLDESDTSLDFVTRKKNVKPLHIERLQGEFLVSYSDFSFFINRNGWLTKPDWRIQWEGTPEAFALNHPYILAFEPNFIEIRHMETTELVDVIVGKNVRLLHSSGREICYAYEDEAGKEMIASLSFWRERR